MYGGSNTENRRCAMECAICGKQIDRFHAVRIGGLIGHITGKHFMCPACVENAKRGNVKLRLVDEW